MNRNGNNRGAVAIFLLSMLSLLVMSGLSLFEIQLAKGKDIHYSQSLSQARFLAQSGLQEARYFAAKVDPSWTGTSAEQELSKGSFDYTTALDFTTHTYSVTARGYVPNKSDPNKVSVEFSTSFNYNPVPIGIVVLDTSMNGALYVSGNGILSITATDGRVVVNSNHASAITVGGSADLVAPEINVVGGVTVGGSGTVTGNVQTGVDPVTDPLAWLPVPNEADYTTQKASAYAISSGEVTLDPGVYVGGIEVSKSATVNLNPGLYYMKGGGFVTKNSANVYGANVIIYNDPSASTETLDFRSSGVLSLTPPEEGDYAGILFFQKRTATATMKLTSQSTTVMNGAFYTRDAGLELEGNGSTTAVGTGYVVKWLRVTGNGSISIIEIPSGGS